MNEENVEETNNRINKDSKKKKINWLSKIRDNFKKEQKENDEENIEEIKQLKKDLMDAEALISKNYVLIDFFNSQDSTKIYLNLKTIKNIFINDLKLQINKKKKFIDKLNLLFFNRYRDKKNDTDSQRQPNFLQSIYDDLINEEISNEIEKPNLNSNFIDDLIEVINYYNLDLSLYMPSLQKGIFINSKDLNSKVLALKKFIFKYKFNNQKSIRKLFLEEILCKTEIDLSSPIGNLGEIIQYDKNKKFIDVFIEELLYNSNKNILVTKELCESVNNYLINNNFSSILLKFNSTKAHENMSKEEIQELIKSMTLIDLCEGNDNLKFNISVEEKLSLHNYLNKQFLLSDISNEEILKSEYKYIQLYNFANYYGKLTIGNNFEFFINKQAAENVMGLNYSNQKQICLSTNCSLHKSYYENLNIIFHEFQHKSQEQEINLNCPNKYTLIFQIENLLNDLHEVDYYKNNYSSILEEVDARCVANINLYYYINELFTPEEINQIGIENFKKKLGISDILRQYSTDEKLYNINCNEYKLKNRDFVLDELIKKNPYILNKPKYSYLNYIYNKNGSRKTIIELFKEMNQTNDQNIKKMYAYWIKTSRYSYESFIDNFIVIKKIKYQENLTNDKIIDLDKIIDNFYKDKLPDFFLSIIMPKMKNINSNNNQKITSTEAIKKEIEDLREKLEQAIDKHKTFENSTLLEDTKSDISILLKEYFLREYQKNEGENTNIGKRTSNSEMVNYLNIKTNYNNKELNEMSFNDFLDTLSLSDASKVFINFDITLLFNEPEDINNFIHQNQKFKQFLLSSDNETLYNILDIKKYNYSDYLIESDLNFDLFLDVIKRDNYSYLDFMLNKDTFNLRTEKLFVILRNNVKKYSNITEYENDDYNRKYTEFCGLILKKLTGDKIIKFEEAYDDFYQHAKKDISILQGLINKYGTPEQIKYINEVNNKNKEDSIIFNSNNLSSSEIHHHSR